jgi:hypothetical protein
VKEARRQVRLSIPRSRARALGRAAAVRKEGRESSTNRHKHALIALVVNSVLQRVVDRIPLPSSLSLVPLRSRSREEISELVERGGHDAVGGVERFFDSVAVVDVDVDVENAGVESTDVH